MYKFGREIDYTVERLSPDNAELLGDFDCGNEAINEYIHEKSIHDTTAIGYLCIDNNERKVLGFATISCSGIQSCVGEMRVTLPAIQIVYFALANSLHKMVYDEQDEHYYFSDTFLCDILFMCREITDKYFGARYIALYSVPDAEHFYRRNSFENYLEYMTPDNNRYIDGCIPMFMEL